MRNLVWMWILALVAPLANAYVYPPSFVYEKWSEQAKGVKRLSYKQTVRYLQEAKPPVQQEVAIDRNGLFRKSDTNSDDIIVVGRTQAALTKKGQKQAISLTQAMNPFEMMWAFGQPDQLLIRLDQLWLKSANHQWFLLGDQKMWMHGQPKSNFLLISSQTYLPTMAQQDGMLYRAEYVPSFSSVFPKKIIVFKDKRPYQEIILDQMRMNPPLSAGLFQP